MSLATANEVLGEGITKLLSDKLYDKRKQAAQEIEEKVKTAVNNTIPSASASSINAPVQRILDVLRNDFIDSHQANYRKGGLIGLASVAIGLDNKVSKFLLQLVVPVLELFKDEDPRVRYYACEALYNISKIANEEILNDTFFNDIFDGLCKLSADVDTEVKTGVQVLDRLMKDIVTQCASKFKVGEFIPLLSQRMQALNPFIRQLVLSWIQMLLEVEGIEMVHYLPAYLEALFDMLKDQTRDIRHNADAALSKLLKAVSESPRKKAIQVINDTAGIVVKLCTNADICCRLSALCWLSDYVNLQMPSVQQANGADNGKLSDIWVELLPDILGGTLNCVNHHEDEISRMAVQLNNELLEMVQNLNNDDFPVGELVERLLVSIQTKDQSMVVCTSCLQWVCMLLAQCPDKMLKTPTLQRLFVPIFETLLHRDDEVCVAALQVLAQIMEDRTPEQGGLETIDGKDLFCDVTHRLLDLFRKDRNMLQDRGRLMIRQLCGHLDPRKLYVTVARAIKTENDLELAQQLVQTFSWILLTAKETKPLREELTQTALADADTTTALAPRKDTGSDASRKDTGSDASLFLELLVPWFHNPVSALALCLWASQYELATELTVRLAAFEPSIDLLRQLDQLVHLLESPIFSRLRLRLLEPQRHPALLKCLLSLAMLLPQAGAFNTLRERIQVVQSGLLLEGQRDSRDPSKERKSWWSQDTTRGIGSAADLVNLLEQFDKVAEARQR